MSVDPLFEIGREGKKERKKEENKLHWQLLAAKGLSTMSTFTIEDDCLLTSLAALPPSTKPLTREEGQCTCNSRVH